MHRKSMIKNNSFYKVWFFVIGMMFASVTSLYGAENFDIFSFLNSADRASDQDVSSFTRRLEEISNECNKSPSIFSVPCANLIKIVRSPLVEKCKSILGDEKIDVADKRYLAKTYFEIKFNDKIRSQHINLEMPNIIKNQLDPLYLLFVEVDERQPINWQTLSLGKRAENSISAIAKLNRIITDNNIDSSVIATTSLRTNLLGYLEYLNDFYTKETNNPAKVGINFILDNNSRSLADLVKITANDEIKKAYSTLKTLVPLPSLDEVLPQLVKSEASPVQPVLTQREMTILDEAIKNPSSDNKALILKTLKKIIAIVQTPNPNSWKLKNEFETIGFDFLWKNTQFDEAIIQIIKKIIDHKALKNITDNNYKTIIYESIKKIEPFLNSPSSASPESKMPPTTIVPAWQVWKNQPQPVPVSPQQDTGQQTFIPTQHFTPPKQSQPQSFPLPNRIPAQQQLPVDTPQHTTQQPFPTVLKSAFQHIQQQPQVVIPKELTHLLKPLRRGLPREDFKAQKEELRKRINTLNTNIALGETIEDADIEDITPNLDLMTPIDLFKVTYLFNILTQTQNRTDLMLHLKDYKLTPPYEGLLSDQDLQEIGQLDRQNAFKSHIDTINEFFIMGCPNKDLDSFVFAVIELAQYQGSTLTKYINKLTQNNFFKTICNFIKMGPWFEKQTDFKKAYTALIQLGKPKTTSNPFASSLIGNKDQANINRNMNTPKAVQQQVPINQQPITSAVSTTATLGQKQQPIPAATPPQPDPVNQAAPVPSQPGSSGAGSWSFTSALYSIGSGLGSAIITIISLPLTLINWLSTWISKS